MKKYFTILLIILSSFNFGKELTSDKARGFFLAIGVGPRLPVFDFASSSELGYGFNLELSYTDNEYLPFFIFSKIGFETFPGSNDFYKMTDYSNFSTNVLPINLGVRYFFPPVLEQIVLIIPFSEFSLAYSYYEKLHQFKSGTGKSNFLESNSKIGISAGAGISMFLTEFLVTYNYYTDNQFVGFDLKVRLPLFISF